MNPRLIPVSLFALAACGPTPDGEAPGTLSFRDYVTTLTYSYESNNTGAQATQNDSVTVQVNAESVEDYVWEITGTATVNSTTKNSDCDCVATGSVAVSGQLVVDTNASTFSFLIRDPDPLAMTIKYSCTPVGTNTACGSPSYGAVVGSQAGEGCMRVEKNEYQYNSTLDYSLEYTCSGSHTQTASIRAIWDPK